MNIEKLYSASGGVNGTAGSLNIYWKIIFIRALLIIRIIKLRIRNWL
jgi:hypothetical protein